MTVRPFLQSLAEFTDDPRTAALIFLALRGGNCAKTDLQAFLKLKGRVDRLDAYLNDLRDPVSGNAVAQNGPGERIHLLPAADWKLIRRRQFCEEQSPEFTFEAGLAEARAAVDGLAPAAPSPRPSPPMGARERKPPPVVAVATTSGGGPPPVAVGPVASVASVAPLQQLAHGNYQVKAPQLVHLGIAEEARRESETRLSAEEIVERIRAGSSPEKWEAWGGWWTVVARSNPDRIQRAFEIAQRRKADNLGGCMFIEIKKMAGGLG